MKIGVAAPVLQVVKRELPDARLSSQVAKEPPLPTHVDLSRQLSFGRSTVDEAGVVLVEMSVLVYEPLNRIREVLKRLPFDRAVAIDEGRRRDADWRWLDERETPRFTTPLLPLTGLLGFSISPLSRKFVEDALAKRKDLPMPQFMPLPVTNGFAKAKVARQFDGNAGRALDRCNEIMLYVAPHCHLRVQGANRWIRTHSGGIIRQIFGNCVSPSPGLIRSNWYVNSARRSTVKKSDGKSGRWPIA